MAKTGRAPAGRPRIREHGVRIGKLPPGEFNAITDVSGMLVGHSTIIEGAGELTVGKGPARTGVTAILPLDRVLPILERHGKIQA